MNAIRVYDYGPDAMRWEEVPDPSPGPGEILVRVRAAGVNPVDVEIVRRPLGRTNPPFTPGADAAGVVEAAQVSGFRPGDSVYVSGSAAGPIFGAYAERVVCRERNVFRLPACVSYSQGAAVGIPYATAWLALFRRARLVPGETVLVHGASGGVGIAAIQLARAHGARVIATASTERGRQLTREQGAHEAIDHDAHERLRELTGGRGVDVLLEMRAELNLAKDLLNLAPGGRIVVIGSRGPVQIDPRQILARHATVTGVAVLSCSEEDWRRAHAAIGAGLESGFLRPFVGRELPMRDAPRAHDLIQQPGSYGKIVLLP